MTSLASNQPLDDDAVAPPAQPLVGEERAAAFLAMSDPIFIHQLIGTVIFEAKKMTIWSSESRTLRLSGGLTAEDVACACIEKCLGGVRRWNRAACPSFGAFCCSQVRSLLSNEVRRAKRNLVDFFSPVPTTGEGGEPLHIHEGVVDDFHATLVSAEGVELARRFLADLARVLPADSLEQRIVTLVLEDPECATSRHCIARLGVSAAAHEAALRRLIRRIETYRPVWLESHCVTVADLREL
jgi:hypothetical protein